MGFFEQIRKLNVEGYAKGGKADGGKDSGGGKSSGGGKDSGDGKSSIGGGKSSTGGGKSSTGSSGGKSSTGGGKSSTGSTSAGGKSGFGGGSDSGSSTDFSGGKTQTAGATNYGGSTGKDTVSQQRASTAPTAPTPRPDYVTVATEMGPRDVLFDEYATISLDPTGINARSIGYVQPEALPEVSPEIESAINDYMNREPTFFDKALDYMSYVSPLAGLANMAAEFTENTIRDQLTTSPNTYAGTPAPGILGSLGRAITRPSEDVDRYAPVTNQNGQIIGSMALDAGGNPVGYTGTQTPNATFNDPNMSDAQRQAASDMINPFNNMGGGGDDNTPNMGQRAMDAAMQNFGQQEPECPEGYMYDTTSQSCVPRPDMAPFPEIPTFTPAPPPMPDYTAAPTVQAPMLSPTTVPSVGIPSVGLNPMSPAPVSFQPANTPTLGLPSLNPFAPRNV